MGEGAVSFLPSCSLLLCEENSKKQNRTTNKQKQKQCLGRWFGTPYNSEWKDKMKHFE